MVVDPAGIGLVGEERIADCGNEEGTRWPAEEEHYGPRQQNMSVLDSLQWLTKEAIVAGT